MVNGFYSRKKILMQHSCKKIIHVMFAVVLYLCFRKEKLNYLLMHSVDTVYVLISIQCSVL